MCGPKPPSAPVLPQYPSLTPEQQAILTKQQGAVGQMGDVVSGVGGQLGQNQSILQQLSGLINPDGSINQNALTKLQQQTTSGSQAAGGAGNAALNYLGSLYGTGGALGATSAAYTSALQGNTPANKGLEFQQKQSFQQMQEQAAQQGVKISGDDWSSAVSDSTAGQKLIQNFQQNANIQNQNYQLGYLGTLAGNMGQLSGAGAQTAATGTGLSQYGYQTPTGIYGNSISGGMGALTPYLQSYQTGLSNLYQPYYQQQIGPYEQQMAQAQANYQAGMNSYNAYQNQIMGWANFGGQLLSPLSTFAGSTFHGVGGGGAGGAAGGYGGGMGGVMGSTGVGAGGIGSLGSAGTEYGGFMGGGSGLSLLAAA